MNDRSIKKLRKKLSLYFWTCMFLFIFLTKYYYRHIIFLLQLPNILEEASLTGSKGLLFQINPKLHHNIYLFRNIVSEHLHMLAQEALDHADLPVLTATLGAAALLKNSLYCYVTHIEDSGNSERYSLLQVILIANIINISTH